MGGSVMEKNIQVTIDKLPRDTVNALAKLLGIDVYRVAMLSAEHPIRVQIVDDQAIVWVTSIFTTDARQLLDLLKDESHEHD
jgi:hypothetical protein